MTEVFGWKHACGRQGQEFADGTSRAMTGRWTVGIYKDLYDFAAKAGSLEGYVYPKGKVDMSYLARWSDNLVKQYRDLPPEAREEIQSQCNETLGRAIQSLVPILGEDHEVIKKLRSLVKGKLPSSPDDFAYRR